MNGTNKITSWYTTEFISNSLRHYLNGKGFRLIEQHSIHFDRAILSTRLRSKEVIEIRGTLNEVIDPETEEQAMIRDSDLAGLRYFLFDAMLSLVNFFSSFKGDDGNHCLCLPDLKQYRQILERVSEYFISNSLYLKIYLVNQNGLVDVFYLNPQKKDRA